jgi:hypothetical protein
MLTAAGVTLEEIGDGNRAAVLALRLAPGQEQFVSSVGASLVEAEEYRRPGRGTGRSSRTARRSGS